MKQNSCKKIVMQNIYCKLGVASRINSHILGFAYSGLLLTISFLAYAYLF